MYDMFSLNPPLPLHLEHSLVRFNLTSFSQPKAASSNVRFRTTRMSSPLDGRDDALEDPPKPENPRKPPPKDHQEYLLSQYLPC